jgi:hypothetical protein
MNRRKILSTSILLVCIAAGATAAFAQGRYANVYSRAQVDGFVRQLETSSDAFYNDFRREVDNSGLSSSTRRTYNGYATQFENAVDRLRSRFDSNDSWWESRNEVRNMITNSQNINNVMNSAAFRRRIERQWNQLRNDINKLADTYDLAGLNGGGWTGGPWVPPGGGGGGQTSRPPAWAQGTFYSTSGPRISMTIAANGSITLTNEGQTFYGRYFRGQMYLNNDVSTVSRSGNGITTYNRNSGQTTYYTRDAYGGGGGGGIDGPSSRPPNWAVGTFYATNGSGIQMTIGADGRITLFNAGQTYYGRYYNGQMYLNNDVSTVNRSGRNGISTYNQNSGQTTVYRRQ